MSSNPNPNADARPLNLSVLNASMLSPKELMAYTRAPGIHIATKQSDNILFTCLPGPGFGVRGFKQMLQQVLQLGHKEATSS